MKKLRKRRDFKEVLLSVSHKRDFLLSTQVSVGLLFGGGDTWTADVFFCMEPAIESVSSNRPN